METLCTICARANSEVVPGKNIKELSGKPLIVHTIEQAKEMIKNGMYFGSHGSSHEWLEYLNYRDQYKELENSKKVILELGMKKNLLSICYPFGSYNNKTLKIAKKLKSKERSKSFNELKEEIIEKYSDPDNIDERINLIKKYFSKDSKKQTHCYNWSFRKWKILLGL